MEKTSLFSKCFKKGKLIWIEKNEEKRDARRRQLYSNNSSCNSNSRCNNNCTTNSNSNNTTRTQMLNTNQSSPRSHYINHQLMITMLNKLNSGAPLQQPTMDNTNSTSSNNGTNHLPMHILTAMDSILSSKITISNCTHNSVILTPGHRVRLKT